MSDRGGTVLLPLEDLESSYERVQQEAREHAAAISERTGRKHIVRVDWTGEMFFVVPLYKEGFEGEVLSECYDSLGTILEEPSDGEAKTGLG